MRIFIDADGCPVVRLAAEIARQKGKECIIVCDTAHVFCIESAHTVTVDKGADSVDFKLANMIKKGDIAVTQDYGLAAMCLSRSAACLNQNGMRYTDDNIERLLDIRYTSKKIRSSGGRLKGPPKRTADADRAFCIALGELIDELSAEEGEGANG